MSVFDNDLLEAQIKHSHKLMNEAETDNNEIIENVKVLNDELTENNKIITHNRRLLRAYGIILTGEDRSNNDDVLLTRCTIHYD